MNKNLSLTLLLCSLFSIMLDAESVQAPLTDKAVFGMGYDIAIKPRVGRIVGDGGTLPLNQLHRGYLEVMYPIHRYFMFGVSIDYTLAMSPRDNDPQLNVSKESKKISSTFLGATAHLRPQLPFSIGMFDVVLYTEAQLGIGTSSPIAFGTEPLSEYEFKDTSNMPSPFPLMFETTPKVGVTIFGWRFIGLDAAFGFRTMWIVHPMVSVPSSRGQTGKPKDSRGAIWYDVTAPFVQLGLKFAF